MSIFKRQKVISHSGKELDFVIDCDDLTDSELGVFAQLIIKRFPYFGEVIYPLSHYGSSVPRLAKAVVDARGSLSIRKVQYILVVDDVLTTGKSMNDCMKKDMSKRHSYSSEWSYVGAVLYARDTCPPWVTPVCDMSAIIKQIEKVPIEVD